MIMKGNYHRKQLLYLHLFLSLQLHLQSQRYRLINRKMVRANLLKLQAIQVKNKKRINRLIEVRTKLIKALTKQVAAVAVAVTALII